MTFENFQRKPHIGEKKLKGGFPGIHSIEQEFRRIRVCFGENKPGKANVGAISKAQK